LALHLPLVAVASGSLAPVAPPPVPPKAVAKSKPAPSAASVLAVIFSNTGESFPAAARDVVGGVGAKLLADPLMCTLWKAYKALFRLITGKLPCLVVSSVLVGGLVAGIGLLANPTLIAVVIMYLPRLIPDLLQYVIAEMGSEFHPQFFGTAHCMAHCRDEGYVPQGPPVGNVLPAPHPPAQPPSWAPAMTFGQHYDSASRGPPQVVGGQRSRRLPALRAAGSRRPQDVRETGAAARCGGEAAGRCGRERYGSTADHCRPSEN